MKQTKTVEQWLNELPKSIRPKADKSNIKLIKPSLSSALHCCVTFGLTPEGHDFWYSLYESLKWAEEG
jgi:hypothetical protein